MSGRAWPYSVVAVVTAALLACGGGTGEGATIRGKITDAQGTQQPVRQEKFGGAGTVSAASAVRVQQLASGGQLTLLAEAEVSAEGSYEVEVPEGQTHLIVQALSAQGEVVAQAIVESSGSAGGTQLAPPMDSETSVEAAVLIEMVAEGVSVAQANAVDLRARINAEMAAEVRAAASDAAAAEAQVRALAQATASAQRARIEWYSRQGISTTQAALFEAQLEAAAALNAALHNGGSAAATAYANFLAQMDAAEEEAGADEETRAQGESNASSAFRATLELRLSSSASNDALVDASSRAAASLEARAADLAVQAILSAGGAASAVQTAAVEAGAELRASVSAAASASAAAAAFAQYQAAISGDASVQGSVLGNYLGVTAGTAVTANAAVDAAVSASAELNSSLQAALGVLLQLTGTVDFNAVADATCDAYADYRAAVATQAAALATFGANAGPAVDVLVIAHASFN